MDVLFRDLTSGEERTITSEAPGKSKDGALIDVKGNNVVYTMSDSFNGEIYVTSAHGGAKRRICGDCGRASSLSPDGEQILTYRQHAPINLVNVTSGKSTPLLHHVKYALSAARFSPDGKWISFLMAKGTGAVDAMLVPFRGESVIPERDWITITTAPANISQVFWSPDGGLIYYVLNLASSSYLMARHLPFRVYEFAARVRPLYYGDMLTVVPGRFIGELSQDHYNIWMMDLRK